MPNTKSAKKALKRSLKLRERNLEFKEKMKNAIKVIRRKFKRKQEITPEDLKNAYSAIDKALKIKLIKKNNAARKKARLMKLYNLQKKGGDKKYENVEKEEG